MVENDRGQVGYGGLGRERGLVEAGREEGDEGVACDQRAVAPAADVVPALRARAPVGERVATR